MEEKKEYKYSEIIVSLSDYLKEGYVILNNLLSLINIDSKVPYDAYIKIDQEHLANIFSDHIEYQDEPYNGRILLFISKSKFKHAPTRMIREYKARYIEDNNPLYSIDHSDFIIRKENGEYIFEQKNIQHDTRAFKPQLSIMDKEKFDKLYQRLEDEGYLTFPSIICFSRGISNHFIAISSQGVEIEETQNLKRGLMIHYDPSNDTFLVRDNRKDPLLSPRQMLDVTIDKKEIHKGYVAIIDNYFAKHNSASLESNQNSQKLLRLVSNNKKK